MKLREKRTLKGQLAHELNELRKKQDELSEARQDLDRTDWQYINAQFNQMALKIEAKQNEIWRLGGKRKTPDVVKFFSTALPMRQAIFN